MTTPSSRRSVLRTALAAAAAPLLAWAPKAKGKAPADEAVRAHLEANELLAKIGDEIERLFGAANRLDAAPPISPGWYVCIETVADPRLKRIDAGDAVRVLSVDYSPSLGRHDGFWLLGPRGESHALPIEYAENFRPIPGLLPPGVYRIAKAIPDLPRDGGSLDAGVVLIVGQPMMMGDHAVGQIARYGRTEAGWPLHVGISTARLSHLEPAPDVESTLGEIRWILQPPPPLGNLPT